jgi:hypothetical protein
MSIEFVKHVLKSTSIIHCESACSSPIGIHLLPHLQWLVVLDGHLTIR